MDIARIAILGVVGVLIGIQFKGVRQEYSAYIGLGVSLLIFFYACEYLGRMKDSVMALGSVLEEGGYLGILFKIIGITYLSEFCAGLCRDAGYNAIASQVEMAGKISLILLSMPVLMSVIDLVVKIVEG